MLVCRQLATMCDHELLFDVDLNCALVYVDPLCRGHPCRRVPDDKYSRSLDLFLYDRYCCFAHCGDNEDQRVRATIA